MRLWHKYLIEVLPRNMLVAQWRELSAIVGAINKNSTPNHRLVNYILEYDTSHFYTYSLLIIAEMEKRQYRVNESVKTKIMKYCNNKNFINHSELFHHHHDLPYFKICYYNLMEKYLRGIVTEREWSKIDKLASSYIKMMGGDN